MPYNISDLNEIKTRPIFREAGKRDTCEMCGRPAAGGFLLFGEDRPSSYLCDFCLLLRYGRRYDDNT